ncbi:hypothetical protein [Mammaliicoccus sciuri]|uniref:hypothetical protein n=1 Tax=Mammaliicoccus sciuri TaxID=1296 RepID=UPI000E696AF0|nr:hypothetical protein [Mammaliicoccus sciuri]RIN80230.1 hypothetical protein BU007_07815 [Mammaliicoccus sciuri]
MKELVEIALSNGEKYKVSQSDLDKIKGVNDDLEDESNTNPYTLIDLITIDHEKTKKVSINVKHIVYYT